MRRANSGFSLTELLVVVGIILVLSGIIYAVMAPARVKSKQTACMENLRGLHKASLLYSADNEGNDVEELDGHTTLYIGFIRALAPYAGSNEVFVCPELKPLLGGRKLSTSYLFTSFLPGSTSTSTSVDSFSPDGMEEVRFIRNASKGKMPLVYCLVHDELHYQRHDPPGAKPFAVYVTTDGAAFAERVSFLKVRPQAASLYLRSAAP